MQNQEPESKPESAEQPSCEGLSSSALFSSIFHPGDSDRGFLMWIHERLEYVHGEHHLMDYMHKLRAIIAEMPTDRKTVSVGQGKNSLETLQQSIVENSAIIQENIEVIHANMTKTDNLDSGTKNCDNTQTAQIKGIIHPNRPVLILIIWIILEAVAACFLGSWGISVLFSLSWAERSSMIALASSITAVVVASTAIRNCIFWSILLPNDELTRPEAQ